MIFNAIQSEFFPYKLYIIICHINIIHMYLNFVYASYLIQFVKHAVHELNQQNVLIKI